jgi:HK97 gp10 family phage protein
MITLRVENVDAVAEALRRYGQRAEVAVDQAVQATGLEVLSDIKKRIQRGPKTGRAYLRGTVSHRASAPGEAPATDTGTLVSSIGYRKVSLMTAEVESRLDYATFLEFGTVNMDPRPSWTPAVEEAGPKLQQRVTAALGRLA